MSAPMRLTVIGTGYLGATHAACLAELGFDVLGVDNDAEKVSLLSRGIVPFAEPGLGELLERHTRSGRLRFTTELCDAAAFADVHFVCVGTPQSADGLAADLTAVRAVVRGLAAHATRDFLIIGKSTVPVGTAQELALDLCHSRCSRGDTGRRLEPGVPARGPRGAGHAAPRPARLRGLDAGGRAGTAPDLRGADRIGRSGARHGPGYRRARQGRRQHVPGHQDLVHQRDGGGQRRLGRRRGRAGRHPRRRLADRTAVPRRRHRLRWRLPAKDIRAFAARATSLRAPSVARLCHEVDAINLAARARPVAMAEEVLGSVQAGGSPYSAPRSSPCRTTYATLLRSTPRASCTCRVPTCASTTPRRASTPARWHPH